MYAISLAHDKDVFLILCLLFNYRYLIRRRSDGFGRLEKIFAEIGENTAQSDNNNWKAILLEEDIKEAKNSASIKNARTARK